MSKNFRLKLYFANYKIILTLLYIKYFYHVQESLSDYETKSAFLAL